MTDLQERASTDNPAANKLLKAEFESALTKLTGLSAQYCDAAWFTLSTDLIKNVQDARQTALTYAKRFTLFDYKQPIFELTPQTKEKIVQTTLGITCNDLPAYVNEAETLADFIENLNENARDCDLVRMDCSNCTYLGTWRDINIVEAAGILLN